MANKLLVLVDQIETQHGRLSDIRAASDKIYIITSVRHKNYSITITSTIACSKWFTACVLILSYYLNLFYSYVVHSYTHTTIILSITIFHTHFCQFFSFIVHVSYFACFASVYIIQSLLIELGYNLSCVLSVCLRVLYFI